jgi:hypothetical protein
MPLKKLHKFLRWFLVGQILFTATSTEEATIITGALCLVLGVLYCKFTDWFYREALEVG